MRTKFDNIVANSPRQKGEILPTDDLVQKPISELP